MTDSSNHPYRETDNFYYRVRGVEGAEEFQRKFDEYARNIGIKVFDDGTYQLGDKGQEVIMEINGRENLVLFQSKSKKDVERVVEIINDYGVGLEEVVVGDDDRAFIDRD